MKKLLIILTIIIILLSGCTHQNTPAQAPVFPLTPEPCAAPTSTMTNTIIPTSTPQPQQVTISGSTSIEHYAVEAADAFMEARPYYRITYQGIGSSAGVINANEGVTQIGAASRKINTEEKEYGMKELVAGYIATAVVVNKNNPVDNLSMEQLKGVFTGEITNRGEVGGPDEPITVFIKESGSGTRGRFEELIGLENSWGYNDVMPDNISVHEGSSHITARAAMDTYTIVYSDTKYKPDPEKTKKISINGYVLTDQNVQNGSYPLYSPFNFVYHEENLNDAAHAFLYFIVSPAGQGDSARRRSCTNSSGLRSIISFLPPTYRHPQLTTPQIRFWYKAQAVRDSDEHPLLQLLTGYASIIS